MRTSTLAMHMSDGLLNAPTALLFGFVAIACLAVALYKARSDLDDRTAPMAGLVAAFVFAAQMINFPVLPGVSGHLLGGALASMLVGPWVGALCVSIVLVVQGLLFADGGLTMLGANITNMALIGTAVGYLVAWSLRRFAVRSRTGLVITAGVAAWINTVAASFGFVVEYALGGAAGYGTGTVALAIVGVHCLIGLGEAVITAVTIAAVAVARPDLVHLLRSAKTSAPTAEEVR
ncbi:energy-coupling factor ABC transporter permease [Saccharopolyspora rosea]